MCGLEPLAAINSGLRKASLRSAQAGCPAEVLKCFFIRKDYDRFRLYSHRVIERGR